MVGYGECVVSDTTWLITTEPMSVYCTTGAGFDAVGIHVSDVSRLECQKNIASSSHLQNGCRK